MTRRLPDVSEFYRSEGRPEPTTARQARAAARQYFADHPADNDAWTGFIVTSLRRAGRQVVRVQIGRRWPHRMTELGYVRSLRSSELIPGMRLTDPAGHRAVVLSSYPDLSLQWHHHGAPADHSSDPASAVWHAAV